MPESTVTGAAQVGVVAGEDERAGAELHEAVGAGDRRLDGPAGDGGIAGTGVESGLGAAEGQGAAGDPAAAGGAAVEDQPARAERDACW